MCVVAAAWDGQGGQAGGVGEDPGVTAWHVVDRKGGEGSQTCSEAACTCQHVEGKGRTAEHMCAYHGHKRAYPGQGADSRTPTLNSKKPTTIVTVYPAAPVHDSSTPQARPPPLLSPFSQLKKS
eukprot:358640-Chlamydomonas_euryale.AAC.6